MRLVDLIGGSSLPTKDVLAIAVSKKHDPDSWHRLEKLRESGSLFFAETEGASEVAKAVKKAVAKQGQSGGEIFALYDDGSEPRWFPVDVR